MIPNRAFFSIFLSLVSLGCVGQTKNNIIYSEIRVDAIPNLTTFKHLTRYEIQLDSMTQKYNKENLKRMLDGTAFIKGTSKDLIDSAIQEQKVLSSILYRENRSRYKMQDYKNGQLLKNSIQELDSISTECSCVLNRDTLKVRMGIWVFGGFAFTINIVRDKFISNYWRDEHKLKIYKLNNTDSLTDNVLVPVLQQQLILDSVPGYKLGKQLTGYFTFKTANYLRAVDYEEGLGKDKYSDKNMETMYTKGIIHFTCKVRKKLQQDE